MPFVVRCLSPEEHKEQVSEVSDCPSWRLISREGRQLVMGLLTVDAEQRPPDGLIDVDLIGKSCGR